MLTSLFSKLRILQTTVPRLSQYFESSVGTYSPLNIHNQKKIRSLAQFHSHRVFPSPVTNLSNNTPTTHTSPKPLDEITKSALSAIRSQLRYYAVAEIVGRPYLITKNDLVIVHRLNDVQLGDILELDRVRELGSKDYTLKGAPYISEAFYTLRATVIEHTKSKMIEIIKKKRRKNYKRRLTHKQTHTVLRISEVEVNDPEKIFNDANK